MTMSYVTVLCSTSYLEPSWSYLISQFHLLRILRVSEWSCQTCGSVSGFLSF